ncbi:septum formation protein Maf [Wolbachia endosymbiont of Cruorifilaria tuberocauda]|uniref:Maf family nucleotide pyrophosphatase n=1 Tax=Wolbachia endosymbiont of Cruorifilaria tuberocauda TaxID=1812111 RepID=UPI00158DD4E9|nr:Maf family nucleotide pyrophosphatase [Wolbachia endosymbiont of Cruorifilaria tuberocauda]QKX01789.1 septum formation protein Maf [Wolbachia endosymbiont of Cruorifilaria tuberocauda]
MKEILLSSLILASSSEKRIALLKQINIKPGLTMSADIDQTPLKKELPKDYSIRIAKSKAEKIQISHPNYFVLGVDTVIACGRRILLKAETVEQAGKYIRLLSGRRHRVYTSVCLLTPNRLKQHIRTVVTIVKFKHLSIQEIKYYLASEEWKNKVGGYNVQGLAEMFVLLLRGSYSSIMGLPLHETYCLLSNYFNLNL